LPTRPATTYVFAAPNTAPALPAEERVLLRRFGVSGYIAALKRRFPAILDIVGILVEPGNLDPTSMILSYMDTRQWGPEQAELARKIQDGLGFTANMNWNGQLSTDIPPVSTVPKNPRNKPCICGSGIKDKKCCGSNR
jgi:SEC-C motif